MESTKAELRGIWEAEGQEEQKEAGVYTLCKGLTQDTIQIISQNRRLSTPGLCNRIVYRNWSSGDTQTS